MKKITIITPTLNRSGMIETAIQSVLDQNYPELEHIIVDGGSTDGTLTILKKYPHLQVVSEPDLGMYDAINKGIRKSTGDLIGVLNSDDRYPPNTFSMVGSISDSHVEVGVIWGSADIIDKTFNMEKKLTTYFPPEDESEIIHFLTFQPPIFNACFFHKSVFDQLGKFLPNLKIAGDREFMLRIALSKFKFFMTNMVLYQYFSHNASKTFSIGSDAFENWSVEHCLFSEYYLGLPETSVEAKKAYRLMHSVSNLSLIKLSIKRGEFANAAGLALHGWRLNPRWPLVFIQRGLNSLQNLFHRDING